MEAAAGSRGAGASQRAQAPPDSPRLMLLCPTCDEPFVPEYPRRCEWCGHDFGDGYEVDPPRQLEQINSRAIALILGLLLLFAGVVVYFMYLFPAR